MLKRRKRKMRKNLQTLIIGASLLAANIGMAASSESNFENVWSEVKSDPYGALPDYRTTFFSLFSFGTSLIQRDAVRTLSTNDDLRPRFQKLVHPAGICFAGTWTIDKASAYTGFFAKGSVGQIIVRASEAMGISEAGSPRAFGLAGKIYPTSIPSDTASYRTANFVTIDDLGGTSSPSFLDLPKRNEPAKSVHASQLLLFPIIAEIGRAFSSADSNPGRRSMHPVAELGLRANQVAVTPHWMMLQSENSERNGEADFRDELRLVNFPGGLRFGILVSEPGNATWTKLGSIVLTDEALSDSCDHRLHFGHPRER
jgi:hypothetical protein